MKETEEGVLIKNIVFDVGGVLLEYPPVDYYGRYVDSEEKARELAEKTFFSDDWEKLDRGLLEREEIIRLFCDKYPDDSETIRKAIGSWSKMMRPNEENVEVARELDEAGYPLYILSNYPSQGFSEVKEKFDFFGLFRDEVISGEATYIKPEDEIYQIMLQKFRLEPEHTLFIDDGKENIEAARESGIYGIHCAEDIDLRQELERLNVSV